MSMIQCASDCIIWGSHSALWILGRCHLLPISPPRLPNPYMINQPGTSTTPFQPRPRFQLPPHELPEINMTGLLTAEQCMIPEIPTAFSDSSAYNDPDGSGLHPWTLMCRSLVKQLPLLLNWARHIPYFTAVLSIDDQIALLRSGKLRFYMERQCCDSFCINLLHRWMAGRTGHFLLTPHSPEWHTWEQLMWSIHASDACVWIFCWVFFLGVYRDLWRNS